MHVVEEIQHSDLNCDNRTWMRPLIVTERPGDIKVVLYTMKITSKVLQKIPFKRIIWNWVVIQFGNILI